MKSSKFIVSTVGDLREFLRSFTDECKLVPNLTVEYKHDGEEVMIKVNSVSSHTKVIKDGDLWFLFDAEKDMPYRVLNSGIYMVESGSWEPCIEFLDITKNETTLIPFWMLAELHRNGKMWKHGGEKMAETLRSIRERQRNEREKE
jgi:hypothetical protein